jgi:two-component system sensor histidine kinase KdpD
MRAVERIREGRSKYIISVLAASAAIAGLIPLRGVINGATTSLLLLLVVLAIATLFGSRAALLASVLAAVSLNFFFLPPFYTLSISEPENWASFFVFLIVALTVGQLSGIARRRAHEAEKLYSDLQLAFDKASDAEALRRSEKLKSSLLDAITHDLRTPLTSIKAATTMLLEEEGKEAIHRTLDPTDRDDLLQVIDEETDRLNSFVDSMVELAKIEAGAASWRKGAASVEEIISAAMERSQPFIDGHHFSVRIADQIPPLRADAKAIAEALYNIFDNAVKYSATGTTITVRVTRHNGTARFAIEDEGAGIPVREREKIFEKFHRIHPSSRGFGLGLAIVRGIIEAHEGKIWVEPGTIGSNFIFELPVNADERQA